MRWIREHKLISALLAILLALVIIFCVSVARGGADSSAMDVVSKGIDVVSGGLSSVADTIKKNVFGIFTYKKLEADIEELQKENNSLKRQLAEAKIEKEQLEQLEELSQLLNYEYTKKEFKIVICGGGSTYTAGIVKNLLEEEELKIKELWLYDIDQERQEKVSLIVKEVVKD